MTLGWIKEDAEERFFAAFAKTGEAALPQKGRVCPHCQASFADMPSLYDHLHRSHAARRPFLLLGGREPGTEDAIRRPMEPGEVEFVACHSVKVSVDAGAFESTNEAGLSRLLTNPGPQSVEVLMTSGRGAQTPVVSRYRLRVRVPSGEALQRADRAFVKLFGADRPHLLQIDTLRARAGGDEVDDYVFALSEYIRGVLNKDRAAGTGVDGPPADWTEAYKRSLHVLSAMPRPLTNILSGLMRFSLNDFSAWREPTGFPLLDFAQRILGPLSEGQMPSAFKQPSLPERRFEVCPVDSGVHLVLRLAWEAGELNRWGVNDEAAARHLATATPFAALDRAKAGALWAYSAIRLGAHASAAVPLRLLLNNDCFGAWADSELTRLGV